MSITDELRTSGIYRPASNRRYFIEEELAAIADRIDAEHEQLERDYKSACEVNERQDEQYREAMGAVRAANERMDLLEAENAKLRELVRDMYAVMVEDAANCDVTYPEQFDDRMRELGIEVDA